MNIGIYTEKAFVLVMIEQKKNLDITLRIIIQLKVMTL